MGIVYEAGQKSIEKKVAVKFLFPTRGNSPPGSASRGPPHLGEDFLSQHSILKQDRKFSCRGRIA